MKLPLPRPARLALCAAGLRLVAGLTLPAIVIAGSSPIHAQTSDAISTASLTGSVLDPRGVPLPGASVSATNDNTDSVAKTVSDAHGRYAFINLSPGKYTIQVEGSGFASTRRNGVQVAAGKTTDV